ncbi:MAG: sulfatase-like hydrolase/transferase [Planctomycetota bacterium]
MTATTTSSATVQAVTEAESLVHLDALLPGARVESASAPFRKPIEWHFGQSQPDWRVVTPDESQRSTDVEVGPVDGWLRISLSRPGAGGRRMLVGGIAADVEAGPLDDWAAVRVRARSSKRLSGIAVAYNVDEQDELPGGWAFMMGGDGTAPVYNDGSAQDYLLPLVPREPGETLRSIGVLAGAPDEAGLEILIVELVPRGADFERDTGVRSVTRAGATRTTLYAHTPARLAFDVDVPTGGRLDLGLACLPRDAVSTRVAVRAGDGEPHVVLEARAEDADAWAQHTADLSPWAGKRVELVLEADSERERAVALWGAPVVSGTHRTERPNVIFYVIDGGGADQMSVYGYERPTTPFLEELAAEAVVFERAFANSTWTQPSTASFMTGLHHSVLGGLRRGLHSTPVPDDATTFAEFMRSGGFQTGAFTTNPNAGRVIGTERGVDVMRDVGDEREGGSSAAELHERLWDWRADYPGQPYWAHVQTTDVHEPNHPLPDYAGRFVSKQQREQLEAWNNQVWSAGAGLWGGTSIVHFYDEAIRLAGIDRHAFYDTRRGLYDETMLQQDAELRAFVQELKDRGEWENTLLVIGSDHGHPAGTFSRWGRGLTEPPQPEWEGALFESYSTRVPFLVVWPAKIEGGRRIDQPVAMIDVLPTVLELVGLPAPEVCQGRSLAPLLLATPEQSLARADELPPVILDEFRVDEATGEMIGNIEIIDGRWGASLEIAPPLGGDGSHGRHAVPAGGRWAAVHPYFEDTPRLLLYDLEDDRHARRAVNDEHPDLVEHYARLLNERWEAHRILAQRYDELTDITLTPEQLEQLQELGYIR